MKEPMPKTMECCGRKPKRTARQLGYMGEDRGKEMIEVGQYIFWRWKDDANKTYQKNYVCEKEGNLIGLVEDEDYENNPIWVNIDDIEIGHTLEAK